MLRWENFAEEPRQEADAARSAAAEAKARAKAAAEARAAEIARIRGDARAEGFAEGVRSAETAAAAELRLLLAEIAERAQDAQYSRDAARAEALSLATRIGRALLETAAPTLARFGLAAEAAQASADALSRAPDAPLVVRAPPERAEAVAEALREIPGEISVIADPGVGALGVRVEWGDGFDAIDLDAAIAAARETLDAHFAAPHASAGAAEEDEERSQAHG